MTKHTLGTSTVKLASPVNMRLVAAVAAAAFVGGTAASTAVAAAAAGPGV